MRRNQTGLPRPPPANRECLYGRRHGGSRHRPAVCVSWRRPSGCACRAAHAGPSRRPLWRDPTGRWRAARALVAGRHCCRPVGGWRGEGEGGGAGVRQRPGREPCREMRQTRQACGHPDPWRSRPLGNPCMRVRDACRTAVHAADLDRARGARCRPVRCDACVLAFDQHCLSSGSAATRLRQRTVLLGPETETRGTHPLIPQKKKDTHDRRRARARVHEKRVITF